MAKIPLSPDTLARSGDVRFEFIRAAGPGGQNVNKVSSAVRLRFDLAGTDLLPDGVKLRLSKMAGNRVTEDGELLIDARRFRTQERNRKDAVNRLAVLIGRSWEPPKKRRKTRVGKAAKKRRVADKRLRGKLKQTRGKVTRHDDR